MSGFLSKFKGGANASGQPANGSANKRDPNAVQPTPLEKHLKDLTGPVRPDGSDKFFGFENYGSTCYSNSIIQCLYYSAPFRSHVINFPPREYIEQLPSPENADGTPVAPRSTSAIPWPNITSPARKVPPPPGTQVTQGRPEESKDSPDYKKRMALQAGPVLDMVHDYSNRYGMEESLFTALKDIFDAMLHNSSRIGVVSPHKFLEILRRENEMFRSAMHQDAHEFLNLLLNEVVENVEAFSRQHPNLNGSLKEQANGTISEALRDPKHHNDQSSTTTVSTTTPGLDTRWVHDLFEGLLTSETRCLTCENLSQRDEPFLDLSVDLAAHTSVTACLRKFSAEEMLCERNKFHCDICGGLQEAEKRMKIKRLPRVLALHLKRFKYTEDLQRLQKLFHRVVYPFHLRLFNTTDDAEDPDRLYELYAVVVHIGGGPYHGHYVSIIKTQDRGWLLFDDELVQPVDKSYVLNFFGGEPVPGVQDAKQLACAYVLFYQETTLEAVLHEQEMEGEVPLPNRTSETVDGLKEGQSARNGFAPLSPVTSHPGADFEGMESLAHSVTLPTPSSLHPVLEPTQTNPAVPNLAPPVSKSRKERKSEAKEKKAAAKAAEKELDERRREASRLRVEAWKKQDEELKAVIEASRHTASEEAAKRGDEESVHVNGKNTKESGLGRFRPGSISLRGSKLFGGKDKDSHSAASPSNGLPPTPQQQHHQHLPVVPQETGEMDDLALSPSRTVPFPPIEEYKPSTLSTSPDVRGPSFMPPRFATGEEKIRKAKFSIGRKKSQTIS